MTHYLTQAAKRLVRLFGLEVHRADKVRRQTMADVLRHLARQGFRPSTVIDVGVAYGTKELYESFPHSYHLLVEPLREYEPGIRAFAERYSGDFVMAAAGSKPGQRVLHVHSDLSSSSLFEEVEGQTVDGEPRSVPVVTLDDLCRDRKLSGPFLIKVDVQGAELEVLDGARRVLQETDVVILEVSLFEFFRQGPQLSDIVAYMKDKGFVVYEIFGGHYRPLDGALAQVDMAFVKECGMFRVTHAYATREQRLRGPHGL
jgi:FkbM family methyltransferase